MLVIPALSVWGVGGGEARHEEFKSGLPHVARPYLKKTKKRVNNNIFDIDCLVAKP
jgi:hypothetical protein